MDCQEMVRQLLLIFAEKARRSRAPGDEHVTQDETKEFVEMSIMAGSTVEERRFSAALTSS
jgi:hypothetical protein